MQFLHVSHSQCGILPIGEAHLGQAPSWPNLISGRCWNTEDSPVLANSCEWKVQEQKSSIKIPFQIKITAQSHGLQYVTAQKLKCHVDFQTKSALPEL